MGSETAEHTFAESVSNGFHAVLHQFFGLLAVDIGPQQIERCID
jgi:hypothetical protein